MLHAAPTTHISSVVLKNRSRIGGTLLTSSLERSLGGTQCPVMCCFKLEMKTPLDWFYDNPSQNQRFSLTHVPEGCSTQGRKPLIENCPHVFLRAKVYRSMTSGRRGTSHSRRYDRELVLKPVISLKKSWGATVVRLLTTTTSFQEKRPSARKES